MISSSSSRKPAILSHSLLCLKMVGWRRESLEFCEADFQRDCNTIQKEVLSLLCRRSRNCGLSLCHSKWVCCLNYVLTDSAPPSGTNSAKQSPSLQHRAVGQQPPSYPDRCTRIHTYSHTSRSIRTGLAVPQTLSPLETI